MKKTVLHVMLLALVALPALSRADVYIDGGVKLWYAEPKVTDRALMFGPALDLSVDGLYWMRAFVLYGEYDYVRSNEPRKVQDFGLHDGEIVGGFNWDIFHFGIGARWMTIVDEVERDGEPFVRRPTSFGPVLAVGAAQSFSEWPWGFEGSPWGWYAGASWMFYDLQDDKGEHLNLEAGIMHVSHGIFKSIGYRYKETFDHEPMEGFTATLKFEF